MENKKRLIDANTIPYEEHYVPDPDSDKQWDYKKELCVLKPVIDQMPTVDAVEVVRCKDCKSSCEWDDPDTRLCYRDDVTIHIVNPCGYCEHGEKKDNDYL